MTTIAEAATRIRAIAAEHQPGAELPLQQDLAREISASLNTTRYAMAKLVEDGTLYRRGRVHFVAHGTRPVAVGTPEQIAERARILWRLRSATVARLARLEVDQLTVLAATGDPEVAARRIRIAAETLHSDHADDIRSRIGLDPRTAGASNLANRRARLAEVLGRPVTEVRERAGARELAGHIEALLDLAGRGLLTLTWGTSRDVPL